MATTSSSNYTSLYSTSTGNATPGATGYGNANVVSLLAVGSDAGGNVVGAINANGNITTTGYFIGTFLGNITGNLVVPGANTDILYNNNGNAGATNNFTFNQATNQMGITGTASVSGNITGGNLRTGGQVSAGGNIYTAGVISSAGTVTGSYFVGNGSLLTGIAANYSNANATSLMANFGSNTIVTTGNITGGYFIGNGSQLTGIAASYGNANVSNFLANGFGSNTISTTGNISGGYILGNGSQLTGLPASYSNANVVSLMAAFGSNTISTTGNVTSGNFLTSGQVSATGNVTAPYFFGNGSQLTGLPATYGNANVANFLPTYGGTVLANLINFTNNSGIIEQGDQRITITGNAQGVNTGAYFNDTGEAAIFSNSYVAIATNTTGNINPTWTFDAVGNLSAPGAISAVGNITAANFIGNITGNVGGGSISVTGNITGGNLLTAGAVSAGGNVTAAYHIGNGSLLSNLTGANVTGTVANAAYAVTAGSAGTANTAQYVTANAQANITSVGILTSLSSSGNITGANINGNGSGLSNITGANVTGQVANALVAGTVYTAAQPNITSVGTLSTLSVNGNTQSGNLLTAGAVSAGGNVTAAYVIGNGSLLTNLTGANVTGTVANATYALNANNSTYAGTVTTNAQPNITSVGILSSLSVSGNVQGGNLLTGGLISSTGTITGSSHLGGVVSVTGNVTGGNVLTGGLISATGTITSAATITGGNIATGGTVSATGNITGANLTITTDAVINGNLTVNGNTTFINSNTVTINDKFINVANNAATAAAANGGGLGVGPVGSEYATLTYNSTANAWNTSIGISATGNIAGTYVIGNGSALTSLTGANVTGTVANATYALNANNSTFAGTVTTNAQPNITSVGTLTSLSVSGNTTSGNLLTGGLISSTGTVTGSSHLGGVVSVTGNITGAYIIGNGSLLSNLTGANVTGTVANATYALNANNSTFAGTVTTNAQPNITSVGILTSLSVSGNSVNGNLLSTGIISAAGTVTGSSLLGSVVSATGNVTGGNLITGGVISATSTITSAANITGGNLLSGGVISAAGTVTGSSFLGGVVSASGNVTGGNFNTAGAVSAAGNVTGTYIIGNGSLLTNITGANVSGTVANATYALNANNSTFSGTVTTNAQPNITSVGILSSLSVSGNTQGGNLLTAGQVSAAGAVTGATLIGSVITATGNITGGNIRTAGLVSATGNVTGSYIIGNGSLLTSLTGANVTGQVANALVAGTVYTAAQPNITSVGTLTSLTVSGNTTSGNLITTGVLSTSGNITGGNLISLGIVTATGNLIGAGVVTTGTSGNISNVNYVTANYFVGNGYYLTGISGGNSTYSNTNVSAFLASFGSNTISTSGNITAGYFVGNGSLLTNITGANVTGTVANATYATSAGSATTAGTVTSNAQANITSVGVLTSLSVSGNTQSGNLLTAGVVSATGNISGNYFIGNGSQLTGISGGGGSPGGSNTQIQYNNASAFAGNANFTFNQATGNVNLGNLIITTSNAINFVNTVAPFTGIPANVTAISNSQIVIGTGFNGNTSLTNISLNGARGGKVLIYDTYAVADSGGPRIAGLAVASILSLTGNISNTNSFLRGVVGAAIIGGGSSNYQVQYPSLNSVQGGSMSLTVGQPNTVVAYGNTNVYSGVGLVASTTLNNGSTAGNLVTLFSSTSVTGVANNVAGLVLQLQGNPGGSSNPIPTNVYGIYMNSATSQGIFGQTAGTGTNTEQMRSATNYYFLRNDDDLAQVKLGSLRLFNEFQYDGANTSGTLAVDKNNGQVQTIYLSGAITSVTFSNFVTSASQTYTPATKYQTDTVTLILRQGSTPYAVTMPTGSAYKYAAGSTTVGATANAVTMISITATYDTVSAANQYLITISPEFT